MDGVGSGAGVEWWRVRGGKSAGVSVSPWDSHSLVSVFPGVAVVARCARVGLPGAPVGGPAWHSGPRLRSHPKRQPHMESQLLFPHPNTRCSHLPRLLPATRASRPWMPGARGGMVAVTRL